MNELNFNNCKCGSLIIKYYFTACDEESGIKEVVAECVHCGNEVFIALPIKKFDNIWKKVIVAAWNTANEK